MDGKLEEKRKEKERRVEEVIYNPRKRVRVAPTHLFSLSLFFLLFFPSRESTVNYGLSGRFQIAARPGEKWVFNSTRTRRAQGKKVAKVSGGLRLGVSSLVLPDMYYVFYYME